MTQDEIDAASALPPPGSFFRGLYFRVIVGIVLGVIVGIFFPRFAASLKPIADGFIKLIRMLIAPIIFLTVAQSATVGLGDRRARREAGRGDEDVDAAVLEHGPPRHPRRRRPRSLTSTGHGDSCAAEHVRERRARRQRFLPTLLVEVGDDDVRAARGEKEGGRAADPLAAPVIRAISARRLAAHQRLRELVALDGQYSIANAWALAERAEPAEHVGRSPARRSRGGRGGGRPGAAGVETVGDDAEAGDQDDARPRGWIGNCRSRRRSCAGCCWYLPRVGGAAEEGPGRARRHRPWPGRDDDQGSVLGVVRWSGQGARSG